MSNFAVPIKRIRANFWDAEKGCGKLNGEEGGRAVCPTGKETMPVPLRSGTSGQQCEPAMEDAVANHARGTPDPSDPVYLKLHHAKSAKDGSVTIEADDADPVRLRTRNLQGQYRGHVGSIRAELLPCAPARGKGFHPAVREGGGLMLAQTPEADPVSRIRWMKARLASSKELVEQYEDWLAREREKTEILANALLAAQSAMKQVVKNVPYRHKEQIDPLFDAFAIIEPVCETLQKEVAK